MVHVSDLCGGLKSNPRLWLRPFIGCAMEMEYNEDYGCYVVNKKFMAVNKERLKDFKIIKLVIMKKEIEDGKFFAKIPGLNITFGNCFKILNKEVQCKILDSEFDLLAVKYRNYIIRNVGTTVVVEDEK